MEDKQKEQKIIKWIIGIASFLFGVGLSVFIGSFIVPLLG